MISGGGKPRFASLRMVLQGWLGALVRRQPSRHLAQPQLQLAQHLHDLADHLRQAPRYVTP